MVKPGRAKLILARVTLTVLTLGVVVLWGVSSRYSLNLRSRILCDWNGESWLWGGNLYSVGSSFPIAILEQARNDDYSFVVCDSSRIEFEWAWPRGLIGGRQVVLPLWLVAMPMVAMTVWSWRVGPAEAG